MIRAGTLRRPGTRRTIRNASGGLKGLKALDDPRPTFAPALNAGEASNRRDRQSCAYFDPTAASLMANASNRPLLFNQLLYVRAHHKREVSFT